MCPRWSLGGACFTLVLGAPLPAQVTEIPAMSVPHTRIDIDDVGPAGPTTLAAINAAGRPVAGNIAAIVLTPSTAARGTYVNNGRLGRGLGMDRAGTGQLVLVDPPSGGFGPFDARIDLGVPAMQFGVQVGNWSRTMAFDFYSGGALVATYVSTPFDGTGQKFFAVPCGSTFDRVDIRSPAGDSEFVITDLSVQTSPGPAADFTVSPRKGGVPLTVTFTDRTCSASGIAAWAWDFENDGTVDSTAPNPTHTYTASGRYTVRLEVTDLNGRMGRSVRSDFVTGIGATNNTRGADVLELQFNEARGDRTANAASTDVAPPEAEVSITNWQVDAGRPNFRGNEPGFGALGNGAGVDTHLPLDVSSATYMWWQRMRTAPETRVVYVFGGEGGNLRCFTGGIAGESLWYRGTAIGDIRAVSGAQNVGVWDHWALVIDDVQGVATWYLNGAVDSVTHFAPGTHDGRNTDFHVGYDSDRTGYVTTFADLDDFRVYARALNRAEVQAALASENPSTTPWGRGCPGPNGVPTLDSAGGAPSLDNADYRLEVGNMEAGRPAALDIGLFADALGTLPLDLSMFLGGGCQLEVTIDIALPLANGSGSASVPLGIPNLAVLAGVHLYAQVIVAGSGLPNFPIHGALSRPIDVNVQN